MIFTPFPNSSHKHSFQLCILFFYSFITFCEPVNTNFCFLQTLGHVLTHWTVVQLPGVISLKKMGSFCFLSATNCQFLAAKGRMSWLSPCCHHHVSSHVQPLSWFGSHRFPVAIHCPWLLSLLVFLWLCNFTLASLINSVMNNFIVGASIYSHGFN